MFGDRGDDFLRVGLNATCLNDRPSGAKQRFVGIYGELIKQLPDVEFVVFEPRDCRVADWFDMPANVVAKTTQIPSVGRLRKLSAGLSYWPLAFKKYSFDIFECFNFPIVKSPSGKTLLTVHDIRGIYPEYGSFGRSIQKNVLGRSLKAADHVITVSESMKKEIQSFSPNAPISVIYNGLDPNNFGPVADETLNNFQRKFALPQKYVLAVGHFEKRKNYLRLIDSMALLRDRGCPCPLVIIGNDSGQKKAVEAKVVALGLESSVKILTGLTDSEVSCAYKLCGLFVFPSLYEGFGIPILEAMAAEQPVVLSDIPVFREITQNQGLYFPCENVEAMAESIALALTSNCERDRLIEYGTERIKTFSFENLAIQLAGLYQSLI